MYAPPVSASTGLIVHRLAARAVIQDWEHGCLSEDPIEHVVCFFFCLTISQFVYDVMYIEISKDGLALVR